MLHFMQLFPIYFHKIAYFYALAAPVEGSFRFNSVFILRQTDGETFFVFALN